MPAATRFPIIAFDLDGVVYNGDIPCGRSSETIALLQKDGYRIFFVTNNSARTRHEITEKLNRLSVHTTAEEVLTSGTAAGLFLKEHFHNKAPRKVAMVGKPGLQQEIMGICPEIEFVPVGGAAEVLVVGFTDEFHYATIQAGLDTLMTGAFFLACNRDAHFPGAGGRRIPGCGALVGAIAGAINREPDAVAGKPNPLIINHLRARLGCAANQILFVGDSVEADIAMANRAGTRSILISPDHPTLTDGNRPTAVLQSIDDLPSWLANHG
jgi:HAD superfamily hydrolase (TIGR01450 family)